MKKATNAVLGRFGRRRKRRLSVEIWVLSRGTGVGLKSLAWTRAWEGGGMGWLVRESRGGDSSQRHRWKTRVGAEVLKLR